MNGTQKARVAKRLFGKDTSGIAAVEFGLLAPILMLMLFGALEVSRAVLMHKRFQRATAMTGDLIAREQTIGTTVAEADAALAGMILAARHVMEPYDTSTLTMRVFSVRAPTATPTQTLAEWEFDSSTANSSSTCANKAMPAANMITAGNTAIVVESSFSYTPLFANLTPWSFSQGFTWTDTITHSPRRGSCVEYAGNQCGALCN